MSEGAGTVTRELQKIHDAGIGVSITWLSAGGVDLRLVHKSGVVAAEGTVQEVADVLPWLEWAIKKNFPNANYQPATRPLRRTPRSTRFISREGTVNREPITNGGAR